MPTYGRKRTQRRRNKRGGAGEQYVAFKAYSAHGAEDAVFIPGVFPSAEAAIARIREEDPSVAESPFNASDATLYWSQMKGYTVGKGRGVTYHVVRITPAS